MMTQYKYKKKSNFKCFAWMIWSNKTICSELLTRQSIGVLSMILFKINIHRRTGNVTVHSLQTRRVFCEYSEAKVTENRRIEAPKHRNCVLCASRRVLLFTSLLLFAVV